MTEKLTLYIDKDEHFALLEAVLNWDTSNYALKNKLEATRESLQAKLEDLGEEDDYSFLDCKQPGCCNCPGMERCDSCGYTEHDKRYLMDHSICDQRRTDK